MCVCTCVLKRDKFRLRVVAADRGDPPLWAEVDVELDVVDRNNKPPLWDLTNYGPIFVKENVTVGTVVTSVKARSVSLPCPSSSVLMTVVALMGVN